MRDEGSVSKNWYPLPSWFRSWAAQRPGAVLLETARFDEENFRTFLFLDPISELVAKTAEEISPVFAEVSNHLRLGRYVAGFVSYECGELIHGITPRQREPLDELPFIRLCAFRAPIIFDHKIGKTTGIERESDVAHAQVSEEPAEVKACALDISEAEYTKRIAEVQAYLTAGHSYQINFTDRVLGTFRGSAIALYEQLLKQQPVSYAAFVDFGRQQIMSISPELFYRVAENRIQVRPMKGTWPRGLNSSDDEQAAEHLRRDTKNRAEHVTIVDLLRNDLGRVCTLGSVRVDELMRVERYSTLHQMTSDISGVLDPDLSSVEVFQALFPSGSITGAPKRRTMEIIREIERAPRGVYTGAIGYFGPDGEACFNVAIRTLLARENRFVLGVGGGVTADSSVDTEFAECKLKASFLQAHRPEFHLIETMRVVSGLIPHLEAHLKRLRDSATFFAFTLHECRLRQEIDARLAHHIDEEARLRLTLERNGHWQIDLASLPNERWAGRVLLSRHQTNSSNIYLQHKTSNRELYRIALMDAQRRGYDEVLFRNECEFIAEGAISNVIASVAGALVTPEISCGVLPGVQRDHILRTARGARSSVLTLSDLCSADELWMCNALRGNRPVGVICDEEGNTLWQAQPSFSATLERGRIEELSSTVL